ncbi:putative metalloprotease CJM1_0395 family protein [Gallaecimonas kandeliae]|uniref:putative metalloprotease CJM1_0395 family protein n=1 Tax=Gallaecimonas kandeliae TaxID=3029055 RepID=UPI0026483630|nr:putative metalloprotease CJM1_0395 family protein [Gallaecimonas kandeliae]WKE66873.1 putative metalloprotease CJM1_0395 family protein [Gallaecimonas kandeliae]
MTSISASQSDSSSQSSLAAGLRIQGSKQDKANPAAPKGADGHPLNEQQLKALQDLKARDREVRTHEQAHASAAGPYAQGVHLQYKRGADGNSYAVEGETSVDTSPVSGDPLATLAKARTILKAALAPAQPSAQDQKVAAEAQQMIIEAQAAIAAQAQSQGQQQSTPQRAYQDAGKSKASLGLDLYA